MPKPTDTELEAMRLKYLGKLARLTRLGRAYAASSIGIVESLDHVTEEDHAHTYSVKVYFDRNGPWFIDGEEWKLELHPGSGVSHD